MTDIREAREVIANTLYEDQFDFCDACNGIGQDDNIHFWCRPCDGKGWVVDPEASAAMRDECEINADGLIAALSEAGITLCRAVDVEWTREGVNLPAVEFVPVEWED